jgi:hypothetical protein
MCTLALLCFIASGTVKAQENPLKDFPSFSKVVHTFFYHYAPEDFTHETRPRFVKKADGWHVFRIDRTVSPEKIMSQGLFWSREKKSFMVLNYPKATSGKWAEIHKARYLDPKLDLIRYNAIHPYVGYNGWYKDVINDFGDMENLSDTMLYGLARAYMAHSENLLGRLYLFADTSLQFSIEDKSNALSADQLKEYRKFARLGIQTLEKLHQRNPNFQTIVGNIKVKYSNDVMNTFLLLRMYQNEKEAKKELKKDLYDDFLISFAKNLLNSCAPNAILFTNGDNDTYPLLYAQSVLGIRKDVLVVNFSLLQMNRYLNSLRQKTLNANPLPLALKKELYADNGPRNYIFVKPELNTTNEHIELRDLILLLAMDEKTAVVETKNGKKAHIPGNQLQVTVDKMAALRSNTIEDTAQAATKMQWTLQHKNLNKSHLAILDVMFTNNWERPIYFAGAMHPENYLNLNDYLQLEGLAYRLLPVKKTYLKNAGLHGTVSPDVMFTNWVNNFSWPTQKPVFKSYANMVVNYRLNANNLADKLFKNNKLDSAKQILATTMEAFPISNYFADQTLPFIASTMYRVGEKEKASKLLQDIWSYYKTEINTILALHDTIAAGRVTELKRHYYAVTILIKVAEYEDRPFYSAIENEVDRMKRNYEQKIGDL